MQALLVRGASVVVGDEIAELDVLAVEGNIAVFGSGLEHDGARIIDAEGLLLGSGFIDIHTHGGGGTSFMTGKRGRHSFVCTLGSLGGRDGVPYKHGRGDSKRNG